MRMTDQQILAQLLPATALNGWQLIGNALYCPPTGPLRVAITVHRGPATGTPLGLMTRTVHVEHGELDRQVFDFDQSGDPWQVAAFDFTHGTVAPGTAFGAYWQLVRAYLGYWLPEKCTTAARNRLPGLERGGASVIAADDGATPDAAGPP